MNLSDTVAIPAQVVARTVGEETMILDLASGTYYGLPHIGARIWQLMCEGKSLAVICDALEAEYAVPREQVEHDVLDLAETLRAKRLIDVV